MWLVIVFTIRVGEGGFGGEGRWGAFYHSVGKGLGCMRGGGMYMYSNGGITITIQRVQGFMIIFLFFYFLVGDN